MNDLLIIIFRTFFGFLLLVIAMKLMGKREIGQLSVFDFLIVLSVADIMIIGIENYDKSIWYFVVPLIIIVFLQKIIALLSLIWPWFREKVDGKERIIISKGKILTKEMKKEKYNMDDLYTQLREKNIRSVHEVEYAILETNGNLSVFTFAENKDHIFPLPLVVSGIIQEENLKLIGKEKEWLLAELHQMDIYDLKSVEGVSLVDGKLQIVEKDLQK